MPTSRCLSLIAAAVLSFGGAAHAEDKLECIRAHAEGQRLRNHEELLEARAQFVSCASQECPAPLQRECVQFLAEVDAVQPSLVVEARDATGQDLSAVSVFVDGEKVADRLSGAPLPVNPGERRVRLVSSDGRAVEQRLVVNEGDKGRRVSATFPSAVVLSEVPRETGEKVTPSRKPVPVLAYVLGGVSVAGLGVFGAFGVTALTKANDLRSSCPANCPSSQIDTMRRDAFIADVALGVSVVSLAGAVVLYLTRGWQPSPAAGALSGPGPFVGAASRTRESD